MSLSPFGIKNAGLRERPYKLFDGGGLYLLIQPNGSKLWRMKFRFHGNERLISFGRYLFRMTFSLIQKGRLLQQF